MPHRWELVVSLYMIVDFNRPLWPLLSFSSYNIAALTYSELVFRERDLPLIVRYYIYVVVHLFFFCKLYVRDCHNVLRLGELLEKWKMGALCTVYNIIERSNIIAVIILKYRTPSPTLLFTNRIKNWIVPIFSRLLLKFTSKKSIHFWIKSSSRVCCQRFCRRQLQYQASQHIGQFNRRKRFERVGKIILTQLWAGFTEVPNEINRAKIKFLSLPKK